LSDATTQEIARTILDGFDKHYRLFRAISGAAKQRFEHGDWAAVREANRVRVDFYDARVREAVAAVQARFPAAQREDALWPRVKQAYIGLLYDHQQPECAETFFNSVACRVLDRTYYRNEYIFWRPAVSTEFIEAAEPTYRCTYPASDGVQRTLRQIIASFALERPFENLARDLRHLLRTVRTELPRVRGASANFHVQVLTSMFFRNQVGYIIGRIIDGAHEQPFAVPVRHRPAGLYLDTILLGREHLAALFSLAQSYFMVQMDVPSAYVTFLQRVLPSKSRAELYTSLGLQKQGKTLFYRDLLDHLRHSSDRFVVAPGTRGLVMAVFTLPSFPFVFKVIRDSFGPPKTTTRAEVVAKYVLVKKHDRVGRMADMLEYSDVALPVGRIAPALLAELESECRTSIERDGEQLVIRHVYIERRMTPLDIWLHGADPDQARPVLDDLGRAIRELAEVNIFPGDLLPKNFGVTRAGRVVFYDYDELAYLTDLRFRPLPPPRDYLDEIAEDPWFSVGPNDIFPEEFPRFLLPPGPYRALFAELHGELFDPRWWQSRQSDLAHGVVCEHFPYPQSVRFSQRYDD
jgi:isocitrate dehydrogenase kinase/phosphatase